MKRSIALVIVALALGAARVADAQLIDRAAEKEKPRTPSRGFGGIGLLVAQPVGEFAQQVGVGGGIGGHGMFRLTRGGAAALRFDLGYIQYGSEHHRVRPFPNIPRIEATLNTDNSIAFASIGPQIMVPSGRFQPYLAGGVGFSYFFTQSSLDGKDDSNEDLFNTTNHHDATFAWSGAAGLYIPVKRGLRPISIDLGARYHGNGRAEYVREGGIHDLPDGSGVRVDAIRSQANLVVYHLGVSFGM